MAFASSGRITKLPENDKNPRDLDPQGRFGLRPRNGENDGDRTRNATLRRRGDSDLDEGWSMVKPRKSFGAEGAERFHGKMGGNFRDEKKPTIREKDEREPARDRQAARPFVDGPVRDREPLDADGRPRNGLNRNKLESWHKTEVVEVATPEKKERDRMKSWRDRDNAEVVDDRANARVPDRRWGREQNQRVEREPEWFDEPAEAQREAHTQQDFLKWMEQMKKAKGGASNSDRPAAEAVVEPEKPPVQATAPVEAAPDKFFMAFGPNSSFEAAAPVIDQTEPVAKPRSTAKSSRFTSFFSQPQEEVRSKVESPPELPPTAPPSLPSLASLPGLAGLAGLTGISSQPASAPHQPPHQPPPPEEERQAFQQLLAKLQKQTLSATPPGPSAYSVPPPNNGSDGGKKSAVTSPASFHQYGGERRNGPIGHPPSQNVHEIIAPRPQQHTARPEQILQDLVGLHQRVASQGSRAPEPSAARNNSNTEFLMNLMRAGPGPGPGQDQLNLMRMAQAQPPKQQQMPQMNDRESEFSPRENRGSQRQMRPQPPPGFPMDESFHNGDHDSRPNQPTQILQRPPPPPGLDQMPPNWMTSGAQLPPPQQRGPMIPPPGLPGGPARNVPLPHMFPPNFPPVAMPPPEAMGGMPPRNMPMPPPGFFNGPPHGFMPHGLGGYNGPPGPPDAHAFGGSPFDGRGMPPGNPGRGAAYGRP